MKRLSKLFLSIFVLFIGLMGAYSHAEVTGMTITLTPGWNVVSTPALLSNISFSNGGDGISFSKLESGLRVSIVPNIETLKPLEGFLVENTNNSDVDMTLIYSDNISPTEAIFQKNLDLGRNFLGITTNVNPFNNIVGNVNMTMDFTYNDSDNLLNSVNSTYDGDQNSSTIIAPQYGEAYAAFITSSNAIYGGINNKIDELGIVTAILTETQTLDAGDIGKIIYTINLTPSKKSIINGVVITKQDGNENFDELFANVKAYINNQEVGTVIVTNEKIVILNLNRTVVAGQSLTIDLRGDSIFGNSTIITGVIEENDVMAVEFNTNKNMGNVKSNYSVLALNGINLNLTNQVIQEQIVAPGYSHLVLLDMKVNSNSELEVIDYTITLTQGEENFNPGNFVDGIMTVYIDGDAYEMDSTTFTGTQQHNFTVSRNRPVRIKVVASLTENAVNTSYKLNLTLNKAKYINGNNIIPLGITAIGHTTSIHAATATIKASTISAPVTSSLFANKEQEVVRFAIKAEDDDITVKSLELTVSPDGTTGTLPEMNTLFDEKLKLVNVENDEVVDAIFEFDTNFNTNGAIHVKDMSLVVTKDATANLKVMASIGGIEDVLDGTVQIDITAGTFKTATTNVTGSTVNTTQGKIYTFRPTAPEITLSKVSDNMFKIIIRNIDENNTIIYNDLVYSLKTYVNDANVDFSGKVCLVDDVNTMVCSNDTNTQDFGRTITHHWYSDEILVKNEEHDYYILIDSNYYIAPSIVAAKISSLSYGITTPIIEKYSLSYTE